MFVHSVGAAPSTWYSTAKSVALRTAFGMGMVIERVSEREKESEGKSSARKFSTPTHATHRPVCDAFGGRLLACATTKAMPLCEVYPVHYVKKHINGVVRFSPWNKSKPKPERTVYTNFH